uniref:Uncharacterized protein n=1 Tax=Rhizophora mucronata TaxID=61149 RepID=A0A2P2PGT5_RHIMU
MLSRVASQLKLFPIGWAEGSKISC